MELLWQVSQPFGLCWWWRCWCRDKTIKHTVPHRKQKNNNNKYETAIIVHDRAGRMRKSWTQWEYAWFRRLPRIENTGATDCVGALKFDAVFFLRMLLIPVLSDESFILLGNSPKWISYVEFERYCILLRWKMYLGARFTM